MPPRPQSKRDYDKAVYDEVSAGKIPELKRDAEGLEVVEDGEYEHESIGCTLVLRTARVKGVETAAKMVSVVELAKATGRTGRSLTRALRRVAFFSAPLAAHQTSHSPTTFLYVPRSSVWTNLSGRGAHSKTLLVCTDLADAVLHTPGRGKRAFEELMEEWAPDDEVNIIVPRKKARDE